MNQYEITTKKKKNAIIDAAIELFKNRGVTAVSMKEIAALAQVSQASIYNYFGSKDAVVSECAKLVMESTLRQAREILYLPIPFPEKINRSLSLCSKGINAAISEYFTAEALKDSTLLLLLTENMNQSKRNLYREYIEYGKNENLINPTIPTDIYLSFIDGLNLAFGQIDVTADSEQTLAHFQSLLLYGLLGK